VIVVVACTRIETLFIRRQPGLRVVHTPMGSAAPGALARTLAGVRPRLVLSTGFCGGLDPILRTGDLVLAERIQHGGRTVPIDPALLAAARGGLEAAGIRVRVGPVTSVKSVIRDPKSKGELAEGSAIAVEMEAGGLADVAREWGSGFLSLRAVLDTVRDELPFGGLHPNPASLLRRPMLTLRIACRAFLAGRAIGRAVPALVGGVSGGAT
jgi:nucleoside phosphorylase